MLDELSELHPLPQCTCGASKELTQREEENQVHLFLGSLDSERYAHVKATILNTEPLPSLRCAFNHILREEGRFTAEMDRGSKSESGSAFYSFSRQKRRDGQRPWCDHCGKLGHIKSKCFELIGYPAHWDTKKSQRGPNKNGGQPAAHLATKEEGQRKEDAKEIASEHEFHGTRGKGSIASHDPMAGNYEIWVLDSGASHHMTPLFSLLAEVRSIQKPFHIIVPTRNAVVVKKWEQSHSVGVFN